MQVPVRVEDAIILEEQAAAHMGLKLFKPHLDVVTQFVHLEYTDVYHVIVHHVMDVEVM